MIPAPAAERLAMARSDVNRACNLLISPTPEALQTCHEALQSAVAAMRQYRDQSMQSRGDIAANADVRALRSEIHRAGRLLQNLQNFSRGWERILGTMSGGYTAVGDPAPVFRVARLNCRG
jgi:hypothetical protein